MKQKSKLRLRSAKTHGFGKAQIHVKKHIPRQATAYLKQKSSFFVAALSLVAFLAGNMMGQHGWYAFWKAALGQYDDSLITYTGTVPPIALVPDFSRWSEYGGNGDVHTFRQVPKDLLVPLPPYDPKEEKRGYEGNAPFGDVYSIGHMGSYETGAEGNGSHPGVDIRVPEGTPIRAIANGIVTRVSDDAGGFGKLIVIRHPHMPDPDAPSYETVLHSSYAHLSAQFVSEGQVVRKGDEIGLSGQTGFATGPHLHFQIDRDTAPWHPYWPFSGAELREARLSTTDAINRAFHQERGYQYTVHPMLLVQSNPAPATLVGTPTRTASVQPTTITRRAPPRQAVSLKSAAEQRRQARIARNPVVTIAKASSSSRPIAVETQTVALQQESAPLPAAPVLVVPASPSAVASVDLQHARFFTGREWMKVRITLLDEHGNTASEKGLQRDLYLKTAYGEAEFRPPVLSAVDFKNGIATVDMLPRGRRTVVIAVEPLHVLSQPIGYEE